MRQFTTLADRQSFCEIYQQVQLGIAFALEKGEETIMQHDFVVCRDFLGDYVTGTWLKMDLGKIYSFDSPGESNPIQTNRACLLLHMPNGERDTFEKNFILLNEMEANANITLSSWEPIEPDKPWKSGHYVKVVGDPVWVYNALTISIYTHVLRCMCIDVGGVDDFDGMSEVIANGDYGTNTDYCQRHVAVPFDIALFLTRVKNVCRQRGTNWGDRLWGAPGKAKDVPTLNDLHYNTGFQTVLNSLEVIRNGKELDKGTLSGSWAYNYHKLHTQRYGDTVKKEEPVEAAEEFTDDEVLELNTNGLPAFLVTNPDDTPVMAAEEFNNIPVEAGVQGPFNPWIQPVDEDDDEDEEEQTNFPEF